MRNIEFILLIVFMASFRVDGQSFTEINTEQLLALTGHANDTTYVVNFWATWCSPCVKEIGYFEDIHRLYSDENLKVVLVSLDFPDQAEKRVTPFLVEKEITAPVYLMTNLSYNDWIERVDPAWSGAIPATLIYKKDQRIFLERELSREEILFHIKQMMN
ncbi:MAG: TlpA disulfide reductase family protein [Bacteroidota bacterium]